MAGQGQIFVELNIDSTEYTKKDKQILAQAKSTTFTIEDKWRTLGSKSNAMFDAQRQSFQNAYDRIKGSSKSTADEIVRAEKLKTEKIKELNRQQFGAHESLLQKMRKNWFAAASAIASIGFAIRSVIGEFRQFEKRMSDVSTLLDDETMPELEGMKQGLLDMMSEVPKSADELGAGLYQTLSAGIKEGSDALNVLRQSARLGTAGLGTTEEAVTLLTLAINNFRDSGLTAEEMANVMFKTVKNGITTVADLSSSFGLVAPLAKEAGISFVELQAVTAALTQVNKSASVSQNAVKASLVALAKPTESAMFLFEKLKVDTFPELIKKTGGYVEALKALKKESDGNEQIFVKAIRSGEALSAVNALLGAQYEVVTENIKDMTDKTDAMGVAFDKQKKTVDSAIIDMSNSFSKLKISLGEAFEPAIQTSLSSISKLVTLLADAVKGFGDMGKAIEKASGGVEKFERKSFMSMLLPAWTDALHLITNIAKAARGLGEISAKPPPITIPKKETREPAESELTPEIINKNKIEALNAFADYSKKINDSIRAEEEKAEDDARMKEVKKIMVDMKEKGKLRLEHEKAMIEANKKINDIARKEEQKGIEAIQKEKDKQDEENIKFKEKLRMDEVKDIIKDMQDKAKIRQRFEEQNQDMGKTTFDITRDRITAERDAYIAALGDKEIAQKIFNDKMRIIDENEAKFKKQKVDEAKQITYNALQEIAKRNQAALVAYKAAMIVETYINASVGASKALAQLGVFGPLAAGIIYAAGVARAQSISAMKIPSYDNGGVSRAKGYYQTGDIEEAHIPLKNGKVPVRIEKETITNNNTEAGTIQIYLDSDIILEKLLKKSKYGSNKIIARRGII